MQLSSATTPAPAPVTPPTTSGRVDGIGELRRGIFTRPVSLVFGPFASNHASMADAISAAKQLSDADAPAAAVVENLFTDQGGRDVPPEQRFSVYGVGYQEWEASRGGQVRSSGAYHDGMFSRTKGYELDDDTYSDGTPHEAMVLVDDQKVWSNGIEPRA